MTEQPASLDRFRKRSPRLLLEEHHACEVPCGCGGLVLRWRNPLELWPFFLQLYTPAEAVAWIDGVLLTSALIDLRPGRHVLAFAISPVERTEGLLRAVLRPSSAEKPRKGFTLAVKPPELEVCSVEGDLWKYSLEQPAENWHDLAFDDRDWDVLVSRPIEAPGRRKPVGYAGQDTGRGKVPGLGLAHLPEGAATHGPVWVRKVFEVPVPLPS